MSDYVPINCLEILKSYEQVFLVQAVSEKVSKKNGATYLLVTLKDVTGTIMGPIWDCELKSILVPGQWVVMNITVESFNDKRNFVTKSVSPFSGKPENITDYIYGPNENILKTYSDILTKMLSDVEDPYYRDILNNSNEHVRLIELLKETPYMTDGRLAHRGGLLIHTNSLLRMALEHYQAIKDNIDIAIDKSLIIAGVLFRNIGYASITKPTGSHFEYTDSGRLLGIRSASMMWCNHILMSTETDMKIVIPEPKKLALQNICLAESIEQCASVEASIIFMINETIDHIYKYDKSFYDHTTRT